MWSDAWVDFIAGWCSGATSVVLLQPLDTVLTRWQAGVLITDTATTAATTATATASVGTASAATSSAGVFAGEVRALVHQYSYGGGFRALWRGSSPMVTAVPVQNALLMGGYGVGQKWYEAGRPDATPQNRYAAIFVGGCVGGVVQSFLMSPVELIKVHQQCHAPEQSPGLLTTTKRVLQQLVRGSPLAWRGLGATLLRDGIPHGVWFASYEACKRACVAYCNNNNSHHNPPTLVDAGAGDRVVEAPDCDEYDETNMPAAVPLVSGAVAATVAWGVGYPADLIKTRLQYDAKSAVSAAASASGGRRTHAAPTAGILDTARALIREANGNVLQGLYRGFTIKLVRAIPSSMIGFGVYESVKKRIESIDM